MLIILIRLFKSTLPHYIHRQAKPVSTETCGFLFFFKVWLLVLIQMKNNLQ